MRPANTCPTKAATARDAATTARTPADIEVISQIQKTRSADQFIRFRIRSIAVMAKIPGKLQRDEDAQQAHSIGQAIHSKLSLYGPEGGRKPRSWSNLPRRPDQRDQERPCVDAHLVLNRAIGLSGSVPPAIGVTSTLAISPMVSLAVFPT
jgi:hypothetical protein